MEYVVILLVAGYVILALVAAFSAARTRAAERTGDRDLPEAVIIVAARNEEDALPGCLQALVNQQYMRRRLRIVVADDGSDDDTEAVAKRFSPHVEYLRVPDGLGLVGKAAAIHAAITHATEDIILLTDADCRPPPHWAQNMATQLLEDGVGVVSGVTSIRAPTATSTAHKSDRLLARVQALDWTLLLTFAAGLSGAGVPLTAMGNNMGFRRRAYEDVGGYPALPASVTEDYALFRALGRAGWDARLLLDKGLENVTLPLPTLKDVFAQRRRWARGGLRADFWVYLVYGLIWTTHAGVLAGCLTTPAVGFAGLAVKLAADAVVLRAGMERLSRPGYWAAFPAFEAYLFGYLIALPISLLTAPRIAWRGRRY